MAEITAEQLAVIAAARVWKGFLEHNPDGVRFGGTNTVAAEQVALAVKALDESEE